MPMDDILSSLASRCTDPDLRRSPKYARLVAAIKDAIADGALQTGERLPTETELTDAMPYSLGTVQKALRELVDLGVLSRSRKTGTFVRDPAPLLDDVSRFNFERPDGTLVSDVRARIFDISEIRHSGRWDQRLGKCRNGFVRVSRLDRIDGSFNCYVETHLRADRFNDMLSLTTADLEGKNVRTFLKQRYGIEIFKTEISIGPAAENADAEKHLSPPPGTNLQSIESIGRNRSGKALFLQTNFYRDTGYRVQIF